ncbi:hypothetical protein G6514_005728 [Epicoccum nigrum]|nr:hypothetical protein G6514_005728 [Epicoccum nigrum]
MKVVFAASLVALALPHAARAGEWPTLQFDPDTISPCVMWEDNVNDLVCEDVRKYWKITPEEFSRWNPSVGLDCKPWNVQSYCVVPLERLPTTTTEPSKTTTTTTSTSITSTLGPSPTSWTELGCFTDENPNYSALEKRVSPEGGDNSNTYAKCQDSCYKAAFIFAGVKAGKECWCGNSVFGDLAANVTECDNPCPGDRTKSCGGLKRLNIFEPVDSFWDENPVETKTQMVADSATKVATSGSSA